MTHPPSPLAHLLETVREVRMALAHVPQLCDELKFQEAAECIDEQLVQLAELLPEAERLGATEGVGHIDTALRIAGAASVLVAMTREDASGLKGRPRSGLTALGRAKPDTGFADVPLF